LYCKTIPYTQLHVCLLSALEAGLIHHFKTSPMAEKGMSMAHQFSMTLIEKIWKTWALPLLTIASLSSSCDLAFGFNKLDYARLNTDLDTAWRQTASYSYYLDTQNEWKSPKEFEHDGGGDCEDFAVHLMYYLGDSSTLYIVKLKSHGTYHAIVRFDGRYLEPQIFNRVYDPDEFDIAYHVGYAATMLFVTNGGSKFINTADSSQTAKD
jgi:hypothetical protein